MNLKAFCAVICIVGGLTMRTFANPPEDVTSFRKLVKAAEEQAVALGCRSASMFVDCLHILHNQPAFVELQSAMVSSWPVAVSNLDAIATTDMQKAIVLCSSWRLPESSFALFLKAVVELVEQGRLDRNLLTWCQHPREGNLTGFIIRHHADPIVKEVIVKSRNIFRDLPKRVDLYDRILTGESLVEFKALEREMAFELFVNRFGSLILILMVSCLAVAGGIGVWLWYRK